MDDLLGMDSGMMGTASTVAYSAPPPPPPLPSSVAPQIHAMAAPHAAVDMDLLSMGMTSAAVSMPHTPPPVPTSAATSSSSISDIFANIDLTAAGGAGGMSSAVDQHNVMPYAINTQEFGRRWGSTPVEAKQSLTVSHFPKLDLEALRRAMPANYHHVESIPQTQESIFAATVTNLGAVVLIHAKIQASRRQIDLIVKSTAQEIPTREIQQINMTFANFRG